MFFGFGRASFVVRTLEIKDFDNPVLMESLLNLSPHRGQTQESFKQIFLERVGNTHTLIALKGEEVVGIASLLVFRSFRGKKLGIPLELFVDEAHRGKVGFIMLREICHIDRSIRRYFGPVGLDLLGLYKACGGTVKEGVVYVEKVLPGASTLGPLHQREKAPDVGP